MIIFGSVFVSCFASIYLVLAPVLYVLFVSYVFVFCACICGCSVHVMYGYCYFMCSATFIQPICWVNLLSKFVQPICWVNLLLCYTSLGYATVNESSCATFIYVCFSIWGHLNCKLLSVHGGLFQLVFTYIVLVISNKG